MQKHGWIRIFILCAAIFSIAAGVCLFNAELLRRPLFQKETSIMTAMSAKYEKDGNLYIIDSGAFRLLCMTLDGKINYSISINKMEEYTKMYDCAVDEMGNLYVYMMETEYDAFLTKRDIIRQYSSQGKMLKDILVIDYTGQDQRPHAFPQFGSLRVNEGTLTFSQVHEESVTLYSYDIFLDRLRSSVFYHPSDIVGRYAVGQLCSKDFENFIYTTRMGDIYEVKAGGEPVLRASFDFRPAVYGGTGGIIPWYPGYGTGEGDIIFFDMASGMVFRIGADGAVEKALPDMFFDELREYGEYPLFTGFGFSGGCFSGVFGQTVWFYNGKEFTSYAGSASGILLPSRERAAIIAVQTLFALGLITLLLGLYIFFFRFLDRFISLFLKQAAIIIPITIIAFFTSYTVTFNAMTERLNREIFKSLHFAVSMASELISGDDVASLRSIKDMRTAEYKKLTAAVKNIINDNKDEWNKLYYAAVYVGENFEYHLIPSNDETNMFRPAPFLDEDSEVYQSLHAGEIYSGIIDYIDGRWAYSDTGIRDSAGKLIGYLEIGFDMTSYQISSSQLGERISLIAACICLIILLVLVGIMSLIISQLRMTAKVLKAIGGGDYKARVSYRARDELGRVGSGLNSMAEELQKQFEYITALNESSIRFVPVQFMEHLGVMDITKMKLGDYVRRNLTVLFFDIRFFSINSEMMSAHENFLFINKVLGIAGPVFRRYNGFVDKYLGDAAMVLFDDAYSAVQAGIELYRRLVLDKQTRVEIGGDRINIGVGIHSGSVMMGIVGENERLSSTVISKNVNLASRLESLTKQTRSGMLISRDTVNQIIGHDNEFQYRFLGMIQAAGTNEVIGVFDVLDALPAEVRKRRFSTKRVFESGIRKYHTKDYRAAYMRFEAVVKADQDDVCAANYLAEARRHMDNPALPSVFMFDKK
jgi:class 3 adenylate cyclase/methyl-accepting chemotaxis protein